MSKIIIRYWSVPFWRSSRLFSFHRSKSSRLEINRNLLSFRTIGLAKLAVNNIAQSICRIGRHRAVETVIVTPFYPHRMTNRVYLNGHAFVYKKYSVLYCEWDQERLSNQSWTGLTMANCRFDPWNPINHETPRLILARDCTKSTIIKLHSCTKTKLL